MIKSEAGALNEFSLIMEPQYTRHAGAIPIKIFSHWEIKLWKRDKKCSWTFLKYHEKEKASAALAEWSAELGIEQRLSLIAD